MSKTKLKKNFVHEETQPHPPVSQDQVQQEPVQQEPVHQEPQDCVTQAHPPVHQEPQDCVAQAHPPTHQEPRQGTSRSKARFPGPAGVLGCRRPMTQSQSIKDTWTRELTDRNVVWNHMMSKVNSSSRAYTIGQIKAMQMQEGETFFKIPSLVGAIKTIDVTTGFNPT